MTSTEAVTKLIESTEDEADKKDLLAFVEALRKDQPLTPQDIMERIWGVVSPSPENWRRFADLKSVLYDAGLITLGRRTGTIRLKTDEEVGALEVQPENAVSLPEVSIALSRPEVSEEDDLNPHITRWLREQDWFTHLYSDAATSKLSANYNPDILGVAVPKYDNLSFFDVELLAVEVKKSKSEFLGDKLLAEVTTYQSFAHYVFAAYYKPWLTIFHPADDDEYDRMMLLQKYGIGVFWVTCHRLDAQNRNYQCVMIQNALRGDPDPDKMANVIKAYGDDLRDAEGQCLPDLRGKARRYFMKEE